MDCGCTLWKDEGDCSQPCGTGAQKQTRKCGDPPKSGDGKECGAETQFVACNTDKVSLLSYYVVV